MTLKISNLICMALSFVVSSSVSAGPKSCQQLFNYKSEKNLSIEKKSVGAIDISRDTPENDPSIQNLTLKEQIPQTKVAVSGINAGIDKNVSISFDAARLVFAEDGYPLKNSLIKSLFDPIKDRYSPKIENGLSFINSDAEFKNISDRQFGYCWGLSTLNKYMTSLAFFDKTQPRNPDINFYRRQIDEIIAGRATVIPGFSSIAELSLIPELELYLKLNSASLWASRAVKTSSINVIKKLNNKMTKQESKSFISDLENRLELGEFPKIIFSSLIPSKTYLGINADMHVTLVYKVEIIKDTTRIYLWDNNFYAKTLIEKPKYIDFLPNGDIKFEPWFEEGLSYTDKSDLLAHVILAPEQDVENLQILSGLNKFCSNPAYKKFCSGSSR